MKICTKCGLDKEESLFSWRKKDVRRSSVCKSCQNAIAKLHYERNKQYYKDKAKRNNPRLRKISGDFVLNYLRSHPCVDCGNTDIRVLQFDHKELIGNKAHRIGHFKGSINKLREEINKCEVRCANCHMIRTASQLGWSRI